MKKLLLIILILRLLFYWNSSLNGKRVAVTGRIWREPTIYEKSQRILIQDYAAYVPKYPELDYGDLVTLRGIVEGREIKNPEVLLIEKPKFLLFNLRNKTINNIAAILPKQDAAIVSGVTLGSQRNISENFWNHLKKSGTAHIVVASGTNVTYTSFFLLSVLLTYLKRKQAIYLTLVGVWLYVTLSGFDPPLVRAAFMGSIVFISQLFGRVAHTLDVLLITVMTMLIFKPAWVGDVGFALSFYATTSLILFEASIYRLLSKIPYIVRKDLSTTLAAQIGVAPIIYITFKQFNILSPIYNVLVLWTVPPIMILGAVSGIVSLISLNLAKFIALLIYPFTRWFIFITTL